MKGFEYPLSVRFGDVDAAGIAYFPNIYGFLHDAFEALWERHVGIRYHELIAVRRLGFPLVHSEVDFHAPLRFGDSRSCASPARASATRRSACATASRTRELSRPMRGT
ncbi:MAG: acyl-CoA thioesterase [Planctomycetota bacterium]